LNKPEFSLIDGCHPGGGSCFVSYSRLNIPHGNFLLSGSAASLFIRLQNSATLSMHTDLATLQLVASCAVGTHWRMTYAGN
jgi:hypothetical protein